MTFTSGENVYSFSEPLKKLMVTKTHEASGRVWTLPVGEVPGEESVYLESHLFTKEVNVPANNPVSDLQWALDKMRSAGYAVECRYAKWEEL